MHWYVVLKKPIPVFFLIWWSKHINMGYKWVTWAEKRPRGAHENTAYLRIRCFFPSFECWSDKEVKGIVLCHFIWGYQAKGVFKVRNIWWMVDQVVIKVAEDTTKRWDETQRNQIRDAAKLNTRNMPKYWIKAYWASWGLPYQLALVLAVLLGILPSQSWSPLNFSIMRFLHQVCFPLCIYLCAIKHTLYLTDVCCSNTICLCLLYHFDPDKFVHLLSYCESPTITFWDKITQIMQYTELTYIQHPKFSNQTGRIVVTKYCLKSWKM